MATNVFDKLVNLGSRAGMNPARTRRAREWFRDLAGISRATPDKMIREYQYKAKAPSVGRMYHFRYDPKGKETLPYYDTFPLIFMVGPAAGGFYGIRV